MTAADSDRLSAVFETVHARESEAAAFADEIKVAVLRNITVEGLDTLVQYHLLAHRIRARVEFGGYGSMAQDVLDAHGPVNRLQPDIVLLFLSIDELDRTYGTPGWTCDAVRAELEALFGLLARHTRATIVVHNFLPPLHPELGLCADPRGADLASQVDELNRFVLAQVRQHAPQFVLADWVRCLLRLGAGQALDARGRYLWRAPFKRAFLDDQARLTARVAGALKGRSRKVLVLDCDNTLWGGVIGEDGLDGIALDPTEHPGRAFYDFQTTVLHLADRGVLVALCSKNDEADVFEVLDRHPACRLRRSHLAAWRINWADKATNIRELAEELNLGLDAFVFVDDNPMECGLVRELLPQVMVLQVPKRLHELPEMLLDQGCFDTLAVTDEDRERGRLYQGEALRRRQRAEYADIDEYLASLGIKARLRRDDRRDVPRMAQLTQKTNQFNVTTRRYSEPEVAAMAGNRDWATYSLTAEDRFGSLGLVGVLFVALQGGVGRIDTFLMSCRALGRRLEDAMIEYCLADLARERGINCWHAEYLPSRKNAQVAGLWDRLGFAVQSEAGGARRYSRPAAPPLPVSVGHITIERE